MYTKNVHVRHTFLEVTKRERRNAVFALGFNAPCESHFACGRGLCLFPKHFSFPCLTRAPFAVARAVLG